MSTITFHSKVFDFKNMERNATKPKKQKSLLMQFKWEIKCWTKIIYLQAFQVSNLRSENLKSIFVILNIQNSLLISKIFFQFFVKAHEVAFCSYWIIPLWIYTRSFRTFVFITPISMCDWVSMSAPRSHCLNRRSLPTLLHHAFIALHKEAQFWPIARWWSLKSSTASSATHINVLAIHECSTNWWARRLTQWKAGRKRHEFKVKLELDTFGELLLAWCQCFQYLA